MDEPQKPKSTEADSFSSDTAYMRELLRQRNEHLDFISQSTQETTLAVQSIAQAFSTLVKLFRVLLINDVVFAILMVLVLVKLFG